jgi:hypothetical protein
MNAEELATILNNAVAGTAKAFERLAKEMRRLSSGNVPTYTLLTPTKARRRRHIVNALNRTKP